MKSKHGFETTRQRSDLMRKIKASNTSPEVVLRKQLWNSGVRYRLNVNKLPGKPDIVIQKYKLIIFIDGEFWHGYNWEEKRWRIKSNNEYWIKKIEGNIARDLKNNRILRNAGYTVLRFWGHQIKKEMGSCLQTILLCIEANSR